MSETNMTSLPIETSNMRTSEGVLRGMLEKKSAERKRLGARQFRSAFFAKLNGSINFKSGPCVQEHLNQDESFSEKGKLQENINEGETVENVLGYFLGNSSGMNSAAGGSSDLKLDEDGNQSDIEKEDCYAFSCRKRKHPSQLFHEGRFSQEDTTSELPGFDRKQEASKSIKVAVLESVSDNTRCKDQFPARSKRVRKDNMQKDYIPWSDFGRPPVKRNEKVCAQMTKCSGSRYTGIEFKSNEQLIVGKNKLDYTSDQGRDSSNKAGNNVQQNTESLSKGSVTTIVGVRKKRKMQEMKKKSIGLTKIQNKYLSKQLETRNKCCEIHCHNIYRRDASRMFNRSHRWGSFNMSCKRLIRTSQKRKKVISRENALICCLKTSASSCAGGKVCDIDERDQFDTTNEDKYEKNAPSTKIVDFVKASEGAPKVQEKDSKDPTVHATSAVKRVALEEMLIPEVERVLPGCLEEMNMKTQDGIVDEDLNDYCVNCINHSRFKSGFELAEELHSKRRVLCSFLPDELDETIKQDTEKVNPHSGSLKKHTCAKCGSYLRIKVLEKDTVSMNDMQQIECRNILLASKMRLKNASDMRHSPSCSILPTEDSSGGAFCTVKGMTNASRNGLQQAQRGLLEWSISDDSCCLNFPSQEVRVDKNSDSPQFDRDFPCTKFTHEGKILETEGTVSEDDCSSTDNHNSFCEKCKVGGDLICCDGKSCKVTYHLSCLDPPLLEVPPDDWYCPDCAYKKICCGIHAVSKGIESIWDVKDRNSTSELDVSEERVVMDREKEVAMDLCSVSGNRNQLHNIENEVTKCLHTSASETQCNNSVFGMDGVYSSGFGSPEDVCIAAVDVIIDDIEEDVVDCSDENNHSQPKESRKVHSSDAKQQELQINCESELLELNSRSRLDGSESVTDRLYFVKYRRAAHVHNKWLPEGELMKEAPKLLASYKKDSEQGKVVKWNSDWAEPCRVIGKKVTMPPRRPGAGRGRGSGYTGYRCVEWFVKWKGLGYENCSWEPADTGVLTKTRGRELIKEYEDRCVEAKRRVKHGKDHVQQLCAGDVLKYDVQPQWVKGGKLNPQQLSKLNTMQRCWMNRINGVIVDNDNQERAVITTAFLLSLFEEFEVVKPVLLVVPQMKIGVWQSVFAQWASNLSVVTYAGTREARELMQRYEFYTEDGYIMVQIILTTFDVVTMDLVCLKELEWEALLVDECETLLEAIENANFQELTSYHILLFSDDPFKDNSDYYLSCLSFLGSHDLLDSVHLHCKKNLLHELKERMSKHILYHYKHHNSSSTLLKEYWVPVAMTCIQVEEYCKSLIHSFDILKIDEKRPDDTSICLQPILLELRELCNYPYFIYPELSMPEPEGMIGKELLDIALKSNGKLQLLDTMLSKAKSECKRVVVLTQMHLYSKKAIQLDILENYLSVQFGTDSYERVDSSLSSARKKEALQRFNGNEFRSFVFLLEKKACGPAIQLNSIDFAVIFDSDWNPENDIQALKKVHFSCGRDLRIYRLYCPHTIEERALIFARRGSTLHMNHEHFTASICQRLLRWGAWENFILFDQFLGRISYANKFSTVTYTLDDINLLLDESISRNHNANSFWRTAVEIREMNNYSKSIPLYTETDDDLIDENYIPSSEFWSKLLKDRCMEPVSSWRRSLGVFKTSICHEDTPNTSSLEENQKRTNNKKIPDEAELFRMTTGPENERGFSFQSSTCLEKYMHIHQKSRSNTTDEVSTGHVGEHCGAIMIDQVNIGEHDTGRSSSREPSYDIGAKEGSLNEEIQKNSKDIVTEQKLLHEILRVDLSRLCLALQLQEHITKRAEHLLSFLVKRFKLQQDSKSLLYAVLLSLCWLAAQQQDCSVNRDATLKLAESCFGLRLVHVNSVYAKVEEQCSKKNIYAEMLLHTSQSLPECSTVQDQQSHEKIPGYLNDSSANKISKTISIAQECMVEKSLLTSASERTVSLAEMDEQGVTQQQVDIIGSNAPLEGQNMQESSHLYKDVQNGPDIQSSPQQLLLMKERLASQKGGRMQELLKQQKDEITKFGEFEHRSREKLKREFQVEYSKLMLSDYPEEFKSDRLDKRRCIYRQTLKNLECLLKQERQKLVERQFLVRDKENKLIMSHLEQINSGQIPEELPNLQADNNIEQISENLPNLHSDNYIETNVLPPLCAQFNLLNEPLSQCISSIPEIIQSTGVVQDSVAVSISLLQSQQRSDETTSACIPDCGSSLLSDRLPELQRHVQQEDALQSMVKRSNAMCSRNMLRQGSVRSEDYTSTVSFVASLPEHREQVDVPVQEIATNEFSQQEFSREASDHQVKIQQIQGPSRISSQNAEIDQEIVGPADGQNISNHPQQIQLQQHMQHVSVFDQVQRNSTSSLIHSFNAPQRQHDSQGSSFIQAVQSTIPQSGGQQHHHDPLGQECLRLRREQEKMKCLYEAEKERLKAQYLKEQETLRKRFDNIIQEERHAYFQRVTALGVNLRRVEMNRRLAEAFKMKSVYKNLIANPGFPQAVAKSDTEDNHSGVNPSQIQTLQQQFLSPTTTTSLSLLSTVSSQLEFNFPSTNIDPNFQPHVLANAGMGNLMFHRSDTSQNTSPTSIQSSTTPVTVTEVLSVSGHQQISGHRMQASHAGLTVVGSLIPSSISSQASHHGVCLSESSSFYFPRSTQLVSQPVESSNRASSANPAVQSWSFARQTCNMFPNTSVQTHISSAGTIGFYDSNPPQGTSLHRAVYCRPVTPTTTVGPYSCVVSFVHPSTSLASSTFSESQLTSHGILNTTRSCTGSLQASDGDDLTAGSMMIISSQQNSHSVLQNMTMNRSHSICSPSACHGGTVEPFLCHGEDAILSLGNNLTNDLNIIYLSDDD